MATVTAIKSGIKRRSKLTSQNVKVTLRSHIRVNRPASAVGLDTKGANPVGRAAAALEAVLADRPRAETLALNFTDAVPAQALGWDHILPLLSLP